MSFSHARLGPILFQLIWGRGICFSHAAIVPSHGRSAPSSAAMRYGMKKRKFDDRRKSVRMRCEGENETRRGETRRKKSFDNAGNAVRMKRETRDETKRETKKKSLTDSETRSD
jgi:hypothetical protein